MTPPLSQSPFHAVGGDVLLGAAWLTPGMCRDLLDLFLDAGMKAWKARDKANLDACNLLYWSLQDAMTAAEAVAPKAWVTLPVREQG